MNFCLVRAVECFQEPDQAKTVASVYALLLENITLTQMTSICPTLWPNDFLLKNNAKMLMLIQIDQFLCCFKRIYLANTKDKTSLYDQIPATSLLETGYFQTRQNIQLYSPLRMGTVDLGFCNKTQRIRWKD